MPRDFQVNVRLCYGEMKALEELARASNLPKSELLRHLLRIESGRHPELLYPPLEDGKPVPEKHGVPEILREILRQLYVHDNFWNVLFSAIKMPPDRLENGRNISAAAAEKRFREFSLRLAAAGLMEFKRDEIRSGKRGGDD